MRTSLRSIRSLNSSTTKNLAHRPIKRYRELNSDYIMHHKIIFSKALVAGNTKRPNLLLLHKLGIFFKDSINDQVLYPASK